MTSNSPKGQEQKVLTALNGVETAIPATSSVPMGGTPMTQPQVVSKLEGFEAAFQAVRDAKAAFQKAKQAREQQSAEQRTFIEQLKAALVALLGPNNPELAKFGFAKKTPVRATSEQNAARAAKARATREMRGTRGKQQKKAVKALGVGPQAVAVAGIVKPPVPPVNLESGATEAPATGSASEPPSSSSGGGQKNGNG